MKLRERALNLLARREHSRAELARKLTRHVTSDGDPEVAGAELQQLLDTLEREGLLSDARFAESLVNARRGRHGSLRVRADLQAKGVSEAELNAALAAAREQDLAAAQTAWRKKFSTPPQDAAERARQMRFLAARGFPADVVRRVVGAASADPDLD